MPEPTNEDLISTLRRRLAEALMRPLTRGPESAELQARLAAHYARALAAMTGASEESHNAHGPACDGDRVVMRGTIIRQVDVVCLIEWDDPRPGHAGIKTWHHETDFERLLEGAHDPGTE